MKSTILLIALLITSNVYSFAIVNSVAYTLADSIYVTALTAVSSEASSISSAVKSAKEEALKIRNDVQDYYQSGKISPFLANKLKMVQAVDESLSINEQLDTLIDASEIILNK